MSDVMTPCERCGGSVTKEGFCSDCGAEMTQLEEANAKYLARKEEDLFTASEQLQPNVPPEGAYLHNRSAGERYALTQSVSKIGRDQTNSIAILKDSYISRHHAWVLFIKGGYWVEDLGSTNGTLLNGDLLTERKQIHPGDCIKLGRTELIFEMS